MKKVALAVLCVLYALPVSANPPQESPETKYDRDGGRLIGVYKLSLGDSCTTPRKFVGTIVKVEGDYPDLTVYVRDRRGLSSVEVSVEGLSMADLGNLYHYILSKGKRVRIDAYACGTGIISQARDIISLNQTAPKRRK
jgi:hypothetical protein